MQPTKTETAIRIHEELKSPDSIDSHRLFRTMMNQLNPEIPGSNPESHQPENTVSKFRPLEDLHPPVGVIGGNFPSLGEALTTFRRAYPGGSPRVLPSRERHLHKPPTNQTNKKQWLSPVPKLARTQGGPPKYFHPGNGICTSLQQPKRPRTVFPGFQNRSKKTQRARALSQTQLNDEILTASCHQC